MRNHQLRIEMLEKIMKDFSMKESVYRELLSGKKPMHEALTLLLKIVDSQTESHLKLLSMLIEFERNEV